MQYMDTWAKAVRNKILAFKTQPASLGGETKKQNCCVPWEMHDGVTLGPQGTEKRSLTWPRESVKRGFSRGATCELDLEDQPWRDLGKAT